MDRANTSEMADEMMRNEITLNDFAAWGDRGASPFFAGREDVLAYLTDHVGAKRLQYQRHGTVLAAMKLVTGCPGIGKTALLDEFASRMNKDYIIVRALPDRLLSVAEINRALREALKGELEDDAMAAVGEWISFRNAAELIKKIRDKRNIERRGIILLIDEAQSIGPDNKHAMLHLLEGCTNQPMFPIFFGLDDTRSQIKRAGSPRLPAGCEWRMSPLSDGESAAVVRRFEKELRVALPDAVRRDIVKDCQGFPKHLATALSTTAGEIVRVGADRLDPNTLRGKIRDARNAYYRERIGGMFDESDTDARSVAANIARAVNDAHTDQRQLGDLARREWEKLGDDRPAARRRAIRTVRRMVRHGLLSQRVDGTYGTPIPSFLAYVNRHHPGRERRAAPSAETTTARTPERRPTTR